MRHTSRRMRLFAVVPVRDRVGTFPISNAACVLSHPSPASLARMIAWARSVTCNLLKMLET